MSKAKHSEIVQLFLSFFLIGAFTFGGGYAMIPLIQKEAVEKRKWIKDAELLDIIAIAESTPGVIAVNSATFVGYRVAGFWGAFAATLGVVVPSFVIIAILSFFIEKYSQIKLVAFAFAGIRAGVVVLMVNAVLKLKKHCQKNVFNIVIGIVAFLVATLFSINVIYILIAAAVFGMIYCKFANKEGE